MKQGDEDEMMIAPRHYTNKYVLESFMDAREAYEIRTDKGIHLQKLAVWTKRELGEAEDDEDLERVMKGFAICVAGAILFPSIDSVLDPDQLGAVCAIWEGERLGPTVLTFLYSGLTTSSLDRYVAFMRTASGAERVHVRHVAGIGSVKFGKATPQCVAFRGGDFEGSSGDFGWRAWFSARPHCGKHAWSVRIAGEAPYNEFFAKVVNSPRSGLVVYFLQLYLGVCPRLLRRTRIKYVTGLTGLVEMFYRSWYQSKEISEMADRRDWGGGGDYPEDNTQRMIERIWESLIDIRMRMDLQAPVPPIAVPPGVGRAVPVVPVPPPPGVEVPLVAPVPPPVLLAEEPVMQVEKFLRLQPPTYSGGSNPDTAEHWVHEIERVFATMRCPAADKVVLAAYQLRGFALE
ncbi:hypothetical protein Taro_054535 [Colocasia esculenta]|uniref:Uncharacterized protein n=1 Tax=Colocasia esculenta TaxID=4460 RepID=A0A843XQQ1_COLES|nr:hypothetical protein [Colocasia esculenta]